MLIIVPHIKAENNNTLKNCKGKLCGDNDEIVNYAITGATGWVDDQRGIVQETEILPYEKNGICSNQNLY